MFVKDSNGYFISKRSREKNTEGKMWLLLACALLMIIIIQKIPFHG